MDYILGEAPILDEGCSVIANLPNVSIKGTIVGRSTTDRTIHPMYIVKCTDGTVPDTTYPYSCFAIPISMIEVYNG